MSIRSEKSTENIQGVPNEKKFHELELHEQLDFLKTSVSLNKVHIYYKVEENEKIRHVNEKGYFHSMPNKDTILIAKNKKSFDESTNLIEIPVKYLNKKSIDKFFVSQQISIREMPKEIMGNSFKEMDNRDKIALLQGKETYGVYPIKVKEISKGTTLTKSYDEPAKIQLKFDKESKRYIPTAEFKKNTLEIPERYMTQDNELNLINRLNETGNLGVLDFEKEGQKYQVIPFLDKELNKLREVTVNKIEHLNTSHFYGRKLDEVQSSALKKGETILLKDYKNRQGDVKDLQIRFNPFTNKVEIAFDKGKHLEKYPTLYSKVSNKSEKIKTDLHQEQKEQKKTRMRTKL